MSRWKAGAIHLSISLIIVVALLAVILLLWYPGILFSVDGGRLGLQIVIGVDLVLGPLLTLVVFKAGKPGLRFDLSCIAIAQFSCLAAGVWIVYKERPLAVVLAFDTFYSLAAQEFEAFEKDPAFLDDFPGSYPKLLYVELPENDTAAEIANVRSQFIGEPLYMKTEDYRSISAAEVDLSRVFRREESVRAALSDVSSNQLDENCHLSKFMSSITSGYVCFDPVTLDLSSFYNN